MHACGLRGNVSGILAQHGSILWDIVEVRRDREERRGEGIGGPIELI
jgi:hypothetical protein